MAQDSTLNDFGGESAEEAQEEEEDLADAELNDTQRKPRDEGPKLVPLDPRTAQSCLCDFGLTVDGLSIAPRKLICVKRMLTSVDLLETFIFLKHINLTFNELTDLRPLEKLHNLRELNASNNHIANFPAGNWPLMTHLDLSNNSITRLRQACMPKLLVLNLNNNNIRRLTEPETGAPFFTGENFPNLHTLQLARNKLYLFDSVPNDPGAPFTLDIRLPRLSALFLGGNSLTSLALYSIQLVPQTPTELSDDQSQAEEREPNREEIVKEQDGSALGVLPELSVLNLRSNGLRDLDGLTLESVPRLQYLNLRENMIDSVMEIAKLQQLPRLQTMILLENPIYEMKDYRLEMRVTVPSLRRLDKEVYTAQENEEADLLLEQQKQE